MADIWRGAGAGVIDPHGDLAESIIDQIPPERSDDVVYFNPSDLEYPIAWNLVDTIPADDRATTADFLVEACKDLFGDSWGPRLQFILYHALRACLDAKHTTLLDVYRMLTDDEHRARIVSQAEDPITRDFWDGSLPAGQHETACKPRAGFIGKGKLGEIFRKSCGAKYCGPGDGQALD